MKRFIAFIVIILFIFFTQASLALEIKKSDDFQQGKDNVNQNQTDSDYEIWKNKWDVANIKLRKSYIFMLTAAGIGTIACIIGMVAALVNASKDPMGDQGSPLVYACAAVGGASVIFTLIGASKVTNARREVKTLENTGRSKGYFSLYLNPEKKSFGISFVLNF